MIIAREEAELFLRKFAEDRTVIGLVSKVAGVTFALNGRVTLSGDSLKIEHAVSSEEWTGGYVTIDLNSFSEFDYQENREAPREIRETHGYIASCLRLDSPEIRCCLYELQLGSGASV